MIHVAVIYFASAAVAAIDDFVFYYRVLQASGKPRQSRGRPTGRAVTETVFLTGFIELLSE